MTVETFVQELKGHWSWVYDLYLSRLYERQWAEWELLAIAGALSFLLLLKIRRRRRRAAARMMYAERLPDDSPIIGVKLARTALIRRNGEDSRGAYESDLPRVLRKQQRYATGAEESDWPEQPVRDLRREIIKRDQTEARLEREISELRYANEQLEREVAGLMVANERLLRQASGNKRIEELSRR